MTKKLTQHQKLTRLLKRGWTSPAQAFHAGCGMKLATRLGEMQQNCKIPIGYRLEDKWVDREYKIYRLVKSPPRTA